MGCVVSSVRFGGKGRVGVWLGVVSDECEKAERVARVDSA